MNDGLVTSLLARLVGVWHDRLHAVAPTGTPLVDDTAAGTPGPSPFENLVYIELDGDVYRQTNVTVRGRPLHVRSFTGRVVEGVLFFDVLGPDAPQHVGVAGGPDTLWFAPREVTSSWQRYAEPDVIRLTGDDERIRTTLLYRDGVLVRSLFAHGRRVATDPRQRVSWDPRGPTGPVHEVRSVTHVFTRADRRGGADD